MPNNRLITRVTDLAGQGRDPRVLAMTPAQRVEMIWQLTVDAWALSGIDITKHRMRRDVVRVIRPVNRDS